MRVLHPTSIVLAMSFAAAAAAGDFDGSVPLKCTAIQGHDCLPTETALLPVTHRTTNKDSLVLQGSDLQFAWSALIDQKTGALTATVADNTGAYVVFGECKAAAAK